MLLLPSRAPFHRRSNRHLHHRRADADAPAIDGRAGEQAISAPVRGNTASSPCGAEAAPGRMRTFARPRPRCVHHRRDSNPLFPWREVSDIFTTSAGWTAQMRPTKSNKKILSRRSERRAAIANPCWFALPSVSGFRLVPSDRPRALGHARDSASPGIRVSRSGLRRDISMCSAGGNKKPSGAVGSGGFVETNCRPRIYASSLP
jgi:hypothetical protein